MLQFVELLLQWKQTLHLLDRTLNIFCGINSLISDKLEYSDVVSRLSILMLQIVIAFMLRQGVQWTLKMISLQFHLIIQRPLCTSLSFDFDAKCYWKMSLPRTSWITTDFTKLYFSSGAHFWTQCIGRTNVFGCVWQIWCFRKKI